MSSYRTEGREVRASDPSLSDEANRRLTEELRQAVGDDHLEVSPDALRRSEERNAESPFVAVLMGNRILLGITFCALVVVGAILSLITGSWWFLPLAAGVHALGTLLVAALALRFTTEVEHVHPSTAALLEEEGVGDPDRLLSDLVEDFAGETQARGAAEIVSTGHNENAADPLAEPAKSTVEQRTSMTPSARASRPAGSGSPIGLMPVAVVVGVVIVSLVVGAVEGGILWIVPAIVWGAAALWLFVILRVDGRAEEKAAAQGKSLMSGGPDRAPGDAVAGARSRLLPIAAVVLVEVVGFCALMALVITQS